MSETRSINKTRTEAFRDDMIAIMVLEIKVPHEINLAALTELAPVFLSCILSFIYVGVYWNNYTAGVASDDATLTKKMEPTQFVTHNKIQLVKEV